MPHNLNTAIQKANTLITTLDLRMKELYAQNTDQANQLAGHLSALKDQATHLRNELQNANPAPRMF